LVTRWVENDVGNRPRDRTIDELLSPDFVAEVEGRDGDLSKADC
jgi:hypothetical protein